MAIKRSILKDKQKYTEYQYFQIGVLVSNVFSPIICLMIVIEYVSAISQEANIVSVQKYMHFKT